MNFGEALAALKTGKRVARAGWNGRRMWLVLVMPRQLSDGDRLTLGSFGAPHIEVYAHSTLLVVPWIGMKTADDCFVPWLASQTDVLAEDWAEAI